jgi:hypothetical protein
MWRLAAVQPHAWCLLHDREGRGTVRDGQGDRPRRRRGRNDSCAGTPAHHASELAKATRKAAVGRLSDDMSNRTTQEKKQGQRHLPAV